MTDATEQSARPSLAGLPWEIWVRICVVESLGATWKDAKQSTQGASCVTDGEAWLSGGPCQGVCWLTPHGHRSNARAAIPDYLTDPAAWGALLEKELCGLHQSRPDGPWKAQWWDDGEEAFLMVGRDDALRLGPICATAAEAVVFGVLAKYDHPDLSSLLLAREHDT